LRDWADEDEVMVLEPLDVPSLRTVPHLAS
jgi:hypothetical protein